MEQALAALGAFLQTSDWYGRENELVNLFAHGFLARQGHAGAPQATQVGIEVAVKQLPRDGGKELVRKDLVLWGEPNQTVWRDGKPVNDPVAVIEFKVNDHRKCEVDLAWLRSFTTAYPNVLGYSVCGFVKESRGIWYARVSGGKVEMDRSVPVRPASHVG